MNELNCKATMMFRLTLSILLVLICGCWNPAPDSSQGKDRIFKLEKPGKEELKNASQDFISDIAANKVEMYDCAVKFLLTDEYRDLIYRRHIRSHRIADGLYLLYKNELALALSRSDDIDYQQLLMKYYYPDGTKDMTARDMLSAVAQRLTYRGIDFYGTGKTACKKSEIDFRNITELSNGNTMSVYSVKWPAEKEILIYNTILMNKNIGGCEVLIPVQHSIVGNVEE